MEPPAPRDAWERAARDLGWQELLAEVARGAASPAGRARIEALEPRADAAASARRATLVRAALALLGGGTPLPQATPPDVGEPLARVTRGAVPTGPELRAFARVALAARELRLALLPAAAAHPELVRALSTEPRLDGLREEIDRTVDAEGEVMDSASPGLRSARARVSEARRELAARVAELITRHADVLRERIWVERLGRPVLPMRADAHRPIEGVVLDSSGSGGTLYVEPRELTPLGNRLRVAEADVEHETALVLAALGQSARLHSAALSGAVDALAEADSLAALARFGAAREAIVLDPAPEPVLDLRAMRHPLLAAPGREVVPNDLSLAAGRGLVLSGPNAGGKTVALQCLGLAAWMVRAGIPLPAAPGTRVGFFEPVLTDVGDGQSIERSLSTFSAHVARLAATLAAAGPRALFLSDELASGTDPDEGSALAVAVLEALVARGAAVAVTTHYERLKQLGATDPRFGNASAGFDFDAMRPTFRITQGVPGASSALPVAARFGIPPEVVARAAELVPDAQLRRERLLAELEVERTRLELLGRELAAERAAQAALRAELERELERARATARDRLAREAGELTAQVREARAEVRRARERLGRDAGGAAALREVERAVSRAAEGVALGSPVEQALRPPTQKHAPRSVSPGDQVYVPKLNARAEVLEVTSRGRVRVQVGPLKLEVALDELAEPPPGKAPAARKAPRAPVAPPVRHDATPVRTPSITCDLRGQRVDEATTAVDEFIDRLLRSGEPAGFVLHGHGTGALKSALRSHLGAHPNVARALPAEPEDGGDAFTVIWTG